MDSDSSSARASTDDASSGLVGHIRLVTRGEAKKLASDSASALFPYSRGLTRAWTREGNPWIFKNPSASVWL